MRPCGGSTGSGATTTPAPSACPSRTRPATRRGDRVRVLCRSRRRRHDCKNLKGGKCKQRDRNPQ
eukprot:4414768-Prorocentrum_lima.AAC.1